MQTPETLNGAIIKSITLREGDEVQGRFTGEYCAYELVVETDKGTLIFTGCHDDSEIKVTPNP